MHRQQKAVHWFDRKITPNYVYVGLKVYFNSVFSAIAAKSTVATNLLKSEVQQPRHNREVAAATEIQRRSKHQHVNARLSRRDDTGRVTTHGGCIVPHNAIALLGFSPNIVFFFSDGHSFFFLGWPNSKNTRVTILW